MRPASRAGRGGRGGAPVPRGRGRGRRPGPTAPVRRARLGDEEALIALWAEALELHAALEPSFFRRPAGASGRAELEAMARAAVAGGRDGVVLVSEAPSGEVVGLLKLRLYDTPAQAWRRPARRAHLEDLVVRAAARRRGHGRALVQAGLAWARERRAAQVILTLWRDNPAAGRFYAALGFRPLSQVLGIEP